MCELYFFFFYQETALYSNNRNLGSCSIISIQSLDDMCLVEKQPHHTLQWRKTPSKTIFF